MKILNKIRIFFKKKQKMAYLVNLIISILGIIVIPYFFSNNFTGFLLGLLITIIIINILGIGWKPLNPTSSIKKNK